MRDDPYYIVENKSESSNPTFKTLAGNWSTVTDPLGRGREATNVCENPAPFTVTVKMIDLPQ